MRTLVVPYGAAGWSEKVRILEGIVARTAGPPYVYNDVLVLVPSARLRRTYGRLFLDLVERMHGARALVPPDIQTLHQFFQRLGGLHLPCRLIDENARLVLIEGITKTLLAGTASVGGPQDILAPSLSAAVADMIEDLGAAGISPERLSTVIEQTDLSDKFQARLIADAYARYEAALAGMGLAGPAGVLASLAERFDPVWISSYRTIIIDGLHDIGELPARVLRKFATHAGCTFLIDGNSPDSIGPCGAFHPLRLVKDSLARLGVRAGEAAGSASPDDRFLADALFSSGSFDEAAEKAPSSFQKELRLLSAVTVREEVSFIAGEVKRALRLGAAPDSIVVTFPSLDEYGPLAEEIFTDHGIPYNRALGRQLSASPVATAVISLLLARQEDFSGPSLLRVFSSPFLKFAEQHGLAPALDRLMRERRITGGAHRLLSAIRSHAADTTGLVGADRQQDLLTRPLEELVDALGPFSPKNAAPLSLWMDRLEQLVSWSGLRNRVDLIRGPLNSNLQAFRKLMETFASLRHAGTLFPEYRYSFSEWLFLLKKTLMHARFQVPPDDEGGVQVLGLEEAMCHDWREVYLGGLIDGRFPQRLPQNIFLPEATLEMLGVGAIENARLNAAYHFYRLLLSAPRVTLTWPENVGDKPVVPSPFLNELAPLRRAGMLKESSGVQFSLRIEESRCIPELAKSLCRAGAVGGLDRVLDQPWEGTEGLRAALGAQPAGPAPDAPLPSKQEFWVTELDQYLRCPYDYYVTNVLGLEPLEEVSEDISPLDRGSKVHAVLRDFYRSWEGPVTEANRSAAQTLLRQFADRAFSREADTFRNRREKDLFLAIMADRFLDAEIGLWKQGMRPVLLERKIEGFRLTLPDGTTAEVHGKIDRIDVDENGDFIIVDYKTGGYPQPRTGTDQDIFQLPLYAVMAQQSLAGGGERAVSLRKPIGLAYYDLAGRTGPRARDVVLFDREARDDHPAAKPQASPKSAADFDLILRQSLDKARAAIEGIRAGRFAELPQDENRCRFCPNAVMCAKDER